MSQEKLCSLSLTAVLLAVSCLAQTRDRAEIGGRISDATGAVVPNVSLLLRNEATGHEYSTISTGTGDFVFPFLPAGSYALTAELAGFARLKIEGIQVVSNQSLSLPLILKVGGPDTALTVTAEPNPIEITNPTVRHVITEKELKDMPILTGTQGRAVLAALALLTPGASAFTPDGKARDITAAHSVNGSPVAGIGFYLDGIDNNFMNSFCGGVTTRGPNPDALSEYSVLSHTFQAEAGTHPVLVHMRTKGGGNQFHGQARGIILNPALTARNFFDKEKKSLPSTNALGFQLSGPVLLPRLYRGQDRTFFLLDLEATRSRRENPDREPLLSDAQRAGDFSGLPEGARPLDPLTRREFPGGRIPSTRILPQSRFYIDQFIRRATEGSEWVGTSSEVLGGTQLTARMDHQLSPSRMLTASFFYYPAWDDMLHWSTEGTKHKFPDRSYALSLNYTHSLSPRAVNSFTFGTTKDVSGWSSVGKLEGVNLTQHGYNIRTATSGSAGFPQVQLLSTNSFDPGGSQYVWGNSVWSWKDDFSWHKGSQTFKMGGFFRWLRGANLDTWSGAPQFSFSDWNSFGSGNEAADFLLGIPESYSQGTDAGNHPRRFLTSLYLQDDIKLRSNVTVNLGLRYELNGVWSDRDGHNAAFRPGTRSMVFPQAPNGVIFTGDRDPLTGHTVGGGLDPPDHNNFAPRVGIAYSPRFKQGLAARLSGGPGRTSLRAGYGIFYVLDRGTGILWMENPAPWFFSANRDASQLNASGGSFANPWGNGPNPFPAPLAGRSFVLPLQGVTFVEPNLREPYQQQWTLSLQRELPQHVTAEVAYVGNTALHLYRKFEVNPGLLTPNANLSNTQARRRYGDFGKVSGNASDGVSSYQALQVVVTRRFAPRLQLSAHYVWAKALDNNGGNGSNMWNFADRDATTWARANFDRRQQFVFRSVWELPGFRRVKVLDKALSGWQASGIVQMRSGMPLNIRNAVDSTLRGITPGFPDITGPFRKLNPREVQTFKLPNGRTISGNFLFDPTVFRTVSPRNAAEARPGTLGRNAFTGPGRSNIDLSLLKRISFAERHRAEIRMDIANLFNHAQFSVPGLSTGSSQFGRTSGNAGPRRIQLLLKYSF